MTESVAFPVKKDVITIKKPVFINKFSVFKNKIFSKFSLVYWIAWYRYKDHATESANLVEARDWLDHNSFVWASSLAKWMINVSVTGWILLLLLWWFTPYQVGPLSFFALGLLAWFITKIKPRWW